MIYTYKWNAPVTVIDIDNYIDELQEVIQKGSQYYQEELAKAHYYGKELRNKKNGYKIKQDFEKAFKLYYDVSFNERNKYHLFMMGSMHYRNNDNEKALPFFLKSFKKGFYPAKSFIDSINKNG